MFSRFDTIPACDGRTDGRTDVQPISITCFSIADARKNEYDDNDDDDDDVDDDDDDKYAVTVDNLRLN